MENFQIQNFSPFNLTITVTSSDGVTKSPQTIALNDYIFNHKGRTHWGPKKPDDLTLSDTCTRVMIDGTRAIIDVWAELEKWRKVQNGIELTECIFNEGGKLVVKLPKEKTDVPAYEPEDEGDRAGVDKRGVKDLSVDGEGVLHAKCLTKEGGWKDSTLDLNKYIGNGNGALVWGNHDFRKFHHTFDAKRVRITGSTLRAQLAKTSEEGKSVWNPETSLQLLDGIKNSNGRLKAIPIGDIVPSKQGDDSVAPYLGPRPDVYGYKDLEIQGGNLVGKCLNTKGEWVEAKIPIDEYLGCKNFAFAWNSSGFRRSVAREVWINGTVLKTDFRLKEIPYKKYAEIDLKEGLRNDYGSFIVVPPPGR